MTSSTARGWLAIVFAVTAGFAVTGFIVDMFTPGHMISTGVASAWDFAIVGLVIGVWACFYHVRDEAQPLVAMLGVAVVGIWFVGLAQTSDMLRRTTQAGLSTDPITGGAYGNVMVAPVTVWVDLVWLNLFVGLAGGAVIAWGLHLHVRQR